MREEITFTQLAVAMGFPGEKELLEALYAKASLKTLCKQLGVSEWLLKKRMQAAGVPIRKRGGARRKAFVFTQEHADLIAANGIHGAAKKLDLSKYTVWKYYAQWRKAQATGTLQTSPLVPVGVTPGAVEDP